MNETRLITMLIAGCSIKYRETARGRACLPVIYDADEAAWAYPKGVSDKLGGGADKKTGLQLRNEPEEEKP